MEWYIVGIVAVVLSGFSLVMAFINGVKNDYLERSVDRNTISTETINANTCDLKAQISALEATIQRSCMHEYEAVIESVASGWLFPSTEIYTKVCSICGSKEIISEAEYNELCAKNERDDIERKQKELDARKRDDVYRSSDYGNGVCASGSPCEHLFVCASSDGRRSGTFFDDPPAKMCIVCGHKEAVDGSANLCLKCKHFAEDGNCRVHPRRLSPIGNAQGTTLECDDFEEKEAAEK
jgi:hypothetical protein